MSESASENYTWTQFKEALGRHGYDHQDFMNEAFQRGVDLSMLSLQHLDTLWRAVQALMSSFPQAAYYYETTINLFYTNLPPVQSGTGSEKVTVPCDWDQIARAIVGR